MTVIPLFDTVVLPNVLFYFKREYLESMRAVPASEQEPALFLVLKEPRDRADMRAEDFYPLALIGRVERIDDDSIGVRSLRRVSLDDLRVTPLRFEANVSDRPFTADITEEQIRGRFEKTKRHFLQFIKQFPWGVWLRGLVQQWHDFGDMICAMAPHLGMSSVDKYHLLEIDSLAGQTQAIEEAINEFMEITELSAAAEDEQKQAHEKIYRESSLKKQIEYLQRMLDEMHPESVTDVRRFEQKIAEAGMSETARREAEKVLNRMRQEGSESHEYGMLYDYLDFLTSLSWKKNPGTAPNLQRAQEILDRDHYGLEKVKDRIIQHLAVMALNRRQSGSILLFVGAPGTGKTSICQSIAEALSRPYARISLGGIRDEAEIRGHRRTYIGAMPGRIMEGIKRSGGSNPVMVLDEVDKLCSDLHGDPSSALLEVLDPEQNATFTDHYLNVPYDLSDVVFICTANTTDSIPEPLLNRMEVIPFRGYTAVEKFYIARQHLLPKAMEKTGLKTRNLKVTDDAIRLIISDYTAEGGVRGLKKQLETLCRVAAVKLVRGEQKSVTVSAKRLPEFLERRHAPRENVLVPKAPGVVNGLAWTAAGGETLFIETALVGSEKGLVVTGQLGDVMKESVRLALTLVRELYPAESEALSHRELHLHIPAGATPKDGPSAGITMTVALASLLTGQPVRADLAMTGEISLRGNLLPIGGLPEKLMAAQRAGIRTVISPAANVPDLEEVAAEVRGKLEILPLETVREALDAALPADNTQKKETGI